MLGIVFGSPGLPFWAIPPSPSSCPACLRRNTTAYRRTLSLHAELPCAGQSASRTLSRGGGYKSSLPPGGEVAGIYRACLLVPLDIAGLKCPTQLAHLLSRRRQILLLPIPPATLRTRMLPARPSAYNTSATEPEQPADWGAISTGWATFQNGVFEGPISLVVL